MSDEERDLVTSEGVDEGSKDSATEADHGERSDEEAPDTWGMRAAGTPENGEQSAAPELVVTGEEDPGPGQRNEVGEG